jgi:hypothetical protein
VPSVCQIKKNTDIADGTDNHGKKSVLIRPTRVICVPLKK